MKNYQINKEITRLIIIGKELEKDSNNNKAIKAIKQAIAELHYLTIK